MSQYALFIEPEVHQMRRGLPGNIRQRIKQLLDNLSNFPRPPRSQPLDITGLDVPSEVELRRIRLDPWRIIYAVNDTDQWVWIIAIRRRPPYDYEDLDELASRLKQYP